MNRKGNRTAVEPLYSVDDVAAMGDYLRRIDQERQQPAYLVWLLCVNGGFRIGDILKLRIGQLCTKGKRVMDYIEIREEKRGKVVRRRIPEQVRRQLQEYVRGLNWRGGVKYQSYLFESSRRPGCAYTFQWMNERLQQAAAACGIDKHVTTHTMRKTFAYHYYVNNKDNRAEFASERECLEYLSHDIMKHRDVAETLRYIGVDQEKIDRTTESICFI